MSASNKSAVEQLRARGIAMGSWYERHFVGWTTSDQKVVAAKAFGARVRRYTSLDPKFSGWEIILPREPNEGSTE